MEQSGDCMSEPAGAAIDALLVVSAQIPAVAAEVAFVVAAAALAAGVCTLLALAEVVDDGILLVVFASAAPLRRLLFAGFASSASGFVLWRPLWRSFVLS